MKCTKCVKSEGNQVFLVNLKKAIARANYFSLWKNVCLVQSFAARRMLNKRRIESVLSIGIAKDEFKALKAHAWIRSGEVYLVAEDSAYVHLHHIR